MDEDIANISSNFSTLCENNKVLMGNIKAIEIDIEHLKEIHSQIIKNYDKKSRFYNYGIYVDDIHLQKIVLEKELILIKDVTDLLMRKAYCDMFRLLLKIIKTIEEIKFENDPMLSSTPKHNDVLSKTKKRELLNSIIIYDETDISKKYSSQDLEGLYNVVNQVYDLLGQSIQDLEKYMSVLETRCEEGYAIRMLLISLKGEHAKLNMDKKNYAVILDEIIGSKITQIKKYLDRSTIISNDLKDNINETIKKEMEEEKQLKELIIDTK
jgi:hypothetical protein